MSNLQPQNGLTLAIDGEIYNPEVLEYSKEVSGEPIGGWGGIDQGYAIKDETYYLQITLKVPVQLDMDSTVLMYDRGKKQFLEFEMFSDIVIETSPMGDYVIEATAHQMTAK